MVGATELSRDEGREVCKVGRASIHSILAVRNKIDADIRAVCVQAQSMASIFVLPFTGPRELTDVPVGSWSERFDWRGHEHRKVESYMVLDTKSRCSRNPPD